MRAPPLWVPTRRHAAAAATAAVVVLAVAGCSGTGTTTSPSTAARQATTVPPPGPAQLGTIVVQPADLPSGWSTAAATPPANPSAETTALSRCAGTSVTAGDVAAVAYSSNFTIGSQSVSSMATSFHSRGDVPADTSALLDAKAGSCLEQIGRARLVSELPAGSKVRSYTVKVTAGTNGLDPNVAAVANSSATYSTGGRSVTLDTETVYLIAPRIEARIDFRSIGRAIPAALRATVINRVAARVLNGS